MPVTAEFSALDVSPLIEVLAAPICSQRAFLQATRCGRTKVDTFLRPHKALQNQRKRPFAEDTGLETWTNRDTCFWIL